MYQIEVQGEKDVPSLCAHPFLPGMLALEMLGRRAHNDHPNNFSRSPPYTDDVKWLLGLAAKLGNTSPPQDHCPPPPTFPTFLSQTSFLALAQS